MALWYAIKCLRDQFDARGKLDYPMGEVCSYGTSLPPAEVLASKGLKAIPIGDYGEAGPDFSRERFDLTQELMVPYTPPRDAADALLDKPAWTPTDTEAALRIILRNLKG